MTDDKERDESPSVRRLANALRHMTSERRVELYKTEFGRVPPATATIGAVAKAVATKFLTSGKEPPEDVVKLMRGYKARQRGDVEPRVGLRTLCYELAARKGGATIAEVRAAATERGIDLDKVKMAKRPDARLLTVFSRVAIKRGFDVRVQKDRMFLSGEATEAGSATEQE
jgi:hypothetical protein